MTPIRAKSYELHICCNACPYIHIQVSPIHLETVSGTEVRRGMQVFRYSGRSSS